MASHEILSTTTLVQWIGKRAELHGTRIAATYIDDDQSESTWTYEQLWRRSCSVAARLATVDRCTAETNESPPRALLLYPPGIEFLAGFFGCQIAGWVPVPTCYPKPGRPIPRLDSAAEDCTPSAILGDRASIDGVDPEKLSPAARSATHLATNIDDATAAAQDWIDPDSLSIEPDSLALLQYTSGSTSDPKGVMVSHRAALANLEAIRRGFGIDWQAEHDAAIQCGVFWLPFFHDMGLIGGILEPLYIGGRTILMSPRSFLQRPIRWLQTISDQGAMISGAPNFAYQLCVDRISSDQIDELDLSNWQIAFSGAEPVLPRTLTDFSNRFSSYGFSASAFYPCYGLAEATLLAAGGDGPAVPTVITVDRESLGAGNPIVVGDGPNTAPQKNVLHQQTAAQQKLVSCGHASFGTELHIVDPVTHREVEELTVGEIWLKGDSISRGYWRRDQENTEKFEASMADGRSGFCRTGDLGFLYRRQLYVTGRLKDVIILRGRNLFPQDIEATVRETIGSEGGQCAAFAVDSVHGEALAIVAELPRRFDELSLADLVRAVRRSVIEVHEVDPRHVWLVRQATVPLTSSGKVQRSRCRELFDTAEMKTKYRYDRSSAGEQVPIAIPMLPQSPTIDDQLAIEAETEHWMTQWLVARGGVEATDIELQKPFADYGLDSMTAVEMSGEIEDWSGIELTPVVAWNYPTIARLSEFIAQQIAGAADKDESVGGLSDAELAGLLDEIEGLSDDEINHALADKRST